MPLTPIWCTGRDYPNGPAIARTGIWGRGPPHVFWFEYTAAAGPFAPWSGQIILMEYRGTPFAGPNPFSNWNWTEGGPALLINTRIVFEAPNFRVYVRFNKVDFSGTQFQEFRSGARNSFSWTSATEIIVVDTEHPGASHLIDNDSLGVKAAPYSILPAGFCKSWP